MIRPTIVLTKEKLTGEKHRQLKMGHHTLANGKSKKCMEMVFKSNQMDLSIKVISDTTKDADRDSLSLPIKTLMKVISIMTCSMGLVHSKRLMVTNILEIGSMTSSKDGSRISFKMGPYSKENMKRARNIRVNKSMPTEQNI